jgi:MYXO-CTERM domain-containing protein
MGGRWGWVLLALLVTTPAVAAGVGPEVLYLNFSDGTEGLERADVDGAAQNRSIMGPVAQYPAFAWPGIADDLDRQALVRDVAERINEAFLPYNILVTTSRPAAGPYTMVMVGGTPALFGMDAHVAGLAFMDCGNHQPANVVFAFPEPLGDNRQGLVSTIAQEAAHALGLQHSSDPDDLMFPRVDLAQRQFQDRDSLVAAPRYCPGDTQNSHRRLLELVGPWPGGDKGIGAPEPAGTTPGDAAEAVAAGCAVASGRAPAGGGQAAAVLLALLFAVRACRRRAGRL